LPAWILEKAEAKINLSLHVLGRRDDGYHELDSIVAFADVCDLLQLRAAPENSCEYSGPFASQLPSFEDNIIFKAWQQARIILAAHAIELPCVEVKLEKNLPVASGIGGGSADAAAMLRALFKLVEFEISQLELTNLAVSLGADVPVCFAQKSCRMQGIGEIVTPYTIIPALVEIPPSSILIDEKLNPHLREDDGLGGMQIVLVNPNQTCSTEEVFRTLGLSAGQTFSCSHEHWHNDLIAPAITVQPAIQTVLSELKNHFTDVRMSGSGATCFGLGGDVELIAERISKTHPTWWVKAARLG
jgi:4-diphosphocytidyl-2-C-methyl-D-erythritol kinase